MVKRPETRPNWSMRAHICVYCRCAPVLEQIALHFCMFYFLTTNMSTVYATSGDHGGLGASTYFSRPRRNALNLCLLCLSWGSSPTRTWRLYKACVFGPWNTRWEEEEKIYLRGREKGINRGTYRGKQKIAEEVGMQRPIDTCVLLFALFSILDIKINKYWLKCGKMRDRRTLGFIIIVQGTKTHRNNSRTSYQSL